MDIQAMVENNQGRLIDKWNHYFPVYERYFSKYRGKEVTILEIGVYHGGSMQLWKEYFGEKCNVYGVDIIPQCKQFEEDRVHIFIGSSADRTFLRTLKQQIPKIDILLDDGGHTMRQQIIAFEELFDHVKEDGVYMCEDCHTSYWTFYGGGYLRRGTFIEYCKALIDKLNAWHFKKLKADDFTHAVRSISFYDSIVVFEKEKMMPPEKVCTGTPSFKDFFQEGRKKKSLLKRIKFRIEMNIEKILKKLRLPTVFVK
jgi:hypothetical protein